MKLDTEFYQLPVCYDAERLAAEVHAIDEAAWKVHPQKFAGNSALLFISRHGDPTDESYKGVMRPTPLLDRCPYLKQVLASLQTVWGRVRLMRIDGHSEANAHADMGYYWWQRLRVHVPIVTTPDVRFLCNGNAVHMAPGECWIFNTWALHNVLNPADRPRIHLVADTVGSPHLWELVRQARQPFGANRDAPFSGRFVPYDPNSEVTLRVESQNQPVVMTPWEQDALLGLLFAEVPSSPFVNELLGILKHFHQHWWMLWATHGEREAGWPEYRQALEWLEGRIMPYSGRYHLANTNDLVSAIRKILVEPALNPDLVPTSPPSGASSAPNTAPTSAPLAPLTPSVAIRKFERPVIIVAAPRSGSTMLFEAMARSPELLSIGGESHGLFEQGTGLHPSERGYDSNRLTADDLTTPLAEELLRRFETLLQDRDGQPLPLGTDPVRLLEKTPKNAVRIPFLAKLFPDARFIYLYREPCGNLGSMIDAWRSGRFVTYPQLPDWHSLPWSLVLPPGWRDWIHLELAEVVARQWEQVNRLALDDLEQLSPDRWTAASYEAISADPAAEIGRLWDWAGVAHDDRPSDTLPHSRFTLTPPDPEKWRRHATAIEPHLPLLEDTRCRAESILATLSETRI